MIPLQPLILSSGRTSKHQVILLLKKSFTMDHTIEMLYMKPYQKIVSYRIRLDWCFAKMHSLKQFLRLKDVELMLEVVLSKHIHASFSAASVLDLGSAHHSLFPWPSWHLGSSQMVVPMSLVTQNQQNVSVDNSCTKLKYNLVMVSISIEYCTWLKNNYIAYFEIDHDAFIVEGYGCSVLCGSFWELY